jgi:hypothetical protein
MSVLQSVRHARCIGNRIELHSGSRWFQTLPGYQQPWLGSRDFCKSNKSSTSVPFACNACLIPHTLLPSVCMFLGLPWQATDVLQPSWLIVLPDLEFQLWPLDASAPADTSRTHASTPADASRTPVAEVGTYGRRKPII